MPDFDRTVEIGNRCPRLRFSRRAVARLVRILDAKHSAIGIRQSAVPPGALSIAFLTDTALARLHADFLDDPSTTDVITFDGDPVHGVAGEICVSVDTAETYARTHRREFSEELTLYLVHGWLHLAGYDDLAPAKKRAMRRAEGRAMQILRQQRAMPIFALSRARGR